MCVKLDINGHVVIFDCGTGILQFDAELKSIKSGITNIDILIGHLHLDHIIGLSVFSPIINDDYNIRLFTKSRNELPASSQLFGIFKPPYWPVDLEKMVKAKIMEFEGAFFLTDNIKVIPLITDTHDDTTCFRVEADKTVVYLIDYETRDTFDERIISFCKNADIVFFDATYFPKDYERKRGWGHSTYEQGMKLAQLCGCKRMVFSHLSQSYSDDIIAEAEKRLASDKYSFAYDGMEFEL